MRVVRFRYRGKVGHFLRAEANVDGLTYPIPPPTALLGLIGAVLGLPKDAAQVQLATARFAVAPVGRLPLRFWHTTNIRKDPPAPLPPRVKKSEKGSSKDQRNMRFAQEWLWKPEYTVWASLPDGLHAELLDRLRQRRWHFNPCLGLAHMFADLDEADELVAHPLEQGAHWVASAAPQDAGIVEIEEACKGQLTLQSLRMANTVTPVRSFTYRSYWVEIQGRPFPFQTAQAVQCGDAAVVWL